MRVLHSDVGEVKSGDARIQVSASERIAMEGGSGSGIGMISYAAASPEVAVGDVGAWVHMVS